ncbi:homeobox KN domain-containing protein [Syncephalis plumigaleata]|nr:homeobox KN domain-containing protein [Syncephalis plumigaleata]
MQHSQSDTPNGSSSSWISTELDDINVNSSAYNVLFEEFPWNLCLSSALDLNLLDLNDPIVAAWLPSANATTPATIDPHLLVTSSTVVNPENDTDSTGKQRADACTTNVATSLENPINQITQQLFLLRNQLYSATNDIKEAVAAIQYANDLSTILLEQITDKLNVQLQDYFKLLHAFRTSERVIMRCFNERAMRIVTHSSYDKETRANHKADVLATLVNWLLKNLHQPYPSAEDKKMLCEQTKLSLTQVNDWFVNARRRYLCSGKTTLSKGVAAMLTNVDEQAAPSTE